MFLQEMHLKKHHGLKRTLCVPATWVYITADERGFTLFSFFTGLMRGIRLFHSVFICHPVEINDVWTRCLKTPCIYNFTATGSWYYAFCIGNGHENIHTEEVKWTAQGQLLLTWINFNPDMDK